MILILQGFFLTVNPEVIQIVAKHAYENNKMFMMNLSAPFISDVFKKPLDDVLPYVDILFGNEAEADVFAKVHDFKTTDRKEIALKISHMEKINKKRNRIVIITQGSEPILLVKDNIVTEYPIIKIPEENVIDTNGAGDAFVGGRSCQIWILNNVYIYSIIILYNSNLFDIFRFFGTTDSRKRYRNMYKMWYLGCHTNCTNFWMYLQWQT